MKSTSRVLLPIVLFLLIACPAWSLPTTCGTTGLLTQPTAQTLNSGNICAGIWSDISEWGQTPATEYDATIVPFAVTLGLGSFMEAYGSFPNLLFNDEEEASGRGYSLLGTKLRLFGQRNSLLKFAVDFQFRRAVSNDPAKDGLTDKLIRGIVSLKKEKFGLHAWGGTLDLEENIAGGVGPFEDVTGFGGGIEFFPIERLRLIAEADSYSETTTGGDKSGEWMAGLQYFISPHLTLSIGYGQSIYSSNLSPTGPESRILIGLSTCQGIGTYSQIKQQMLPPKEDIDEEKTEPVNTLKIKTLSPLLVKPKQAPVAPAILPPAPEVIEPLEQPVSPAIPIMTLEEILAAPAAASAVEVLIEDDAEIILLEPNQNISTTETFAKIAGQQSLSTVSTPAMAGTERHPIDPTTTNRAKVYRRFLMPEFAFEVNQFALTPEGSAALSMIAVELSRDNNWYAMRIDGHTDSTGSDRYNMDLSLSRAVQYGTQLTKNGVEPERVYVQGFGETYPIATNETREGRALNRRVELLVLVPPDVVVPKPADEVVPAEPTDEVVPAEPTD
ncbi:MAG: hypothetical protein C0623_03910, partial [Desulfuromonas sp.]